MIDSIAAVIQSKIGSVQAGSVFAQLQSAAMGGAAMKVIQRLATIAFTHLLGAAAIGAVAYKLLEASGNPTDFKVEEWKIWELESRVNITSSGKMVKWNLIPEAGTQVISVAG